jgi:hypothetical protein
MTPLRLPLIRPANKRRSFACGRNNDRPTARLSANEVFFILQFCRNKYRKEKIAKLDLDGGKKNLIIWASFVSTGLDSNRD